MIPAGRGVAGRPPPDPMVRAVGLGYRYPSGRRGVEAVDLAVAPGEIVVLLGPNGAGKTTLLRLMATDLVPADGTLELLGLPAVPPTPSLRRRMGLAGQETVHLDPLTGRENALLFARAGGLAPGEADGSVQRLLEAFHLAEDADLPAGRYSFGMRRKLLLVEALAHEPAFLLLDEPTVGLDPPAREALRRILRDRSRNGTATVLAMNEVEEAARLAHRVIFLHRGRIAADAPPADLLARLQGGTEIEVELGRLPASPLPSLPGIEAVSLVDGRLRARSREGSRILPDMLSALLAAGGEVRTVSVRDPHLGDVFRLLTGEGLSAGREGAGEGDASPAGEGA